jgi:hypothetical protein
MGRQQHDDAWQSRFADTPLPEPAIVLRLNYTFTARSYRDGHEADGRTREEALAKLQTGEARSLY